MRLGRFAVLRLSASLILLGTLIGCGGDSSAPSGSGSSPNSKSGNRRLLQPEN